MTRKRLLVDTSTSTLTMQEGAQFRIGQGSGSNAGRCRYAGCKRCHRGLTEIFFPWIFIGHSSEINKFVTERQ